MSVRPDSALARLRRLQRDLPAARIARRAGGGARKGRFRGAWRGVSALLFGSLLVLCGRTYIGQRLNLSDQAERVLRLQIGPQLEKQLGAKVEFGRVETDWLGRVVVRDIFVGRDASLPTGALLRAQSVTLALDLPGIALGRAALPAAIQSVTVQSPQIYLRRDTSGFNLSRLIPKSSGGDATRWDGQVSVLNGRLYYLDTTLKNAAKEALLLDARGIDAQLRAASDGPYRGAARIGTPLLGAGALRLSPITADGSLQADAKSGLFTLETAAAPFAPLVAYAFPRREIIPRAAPSRGASATEAANSAGTVGGRVTLALSDGALQAHGALLLRDLAFSAPSLRTSGAKTALQIDALNAPVEFAGEAFSTSGASFQALGTSFCVAGAAALQGDLPFDLQVQTPALPLAALRPLLPSGASFSARAASLRAHLSGNAGGKARKIDARGSLAASGATLASVPNRARAALPTLQSEWAATATLRPDNSLADWKLAARARASNPKIGLANDQLAARNAVFTVRAAQNAGLEVGADARTFALVSPRFGRSNGQALRVLASAPNAARPTWSGTFGVQKAATDAINWTALSPALARTLKSSGALDLNAQFAGLDASLDTKKVRGAATFGLASLGLNPRAFAAPGVLPLRDADFSLSALRGRVALSRGVVSLSRAAAVSGFGPLRLDASAPLDTPNAARVALSLPDVRLEAARLAPFLNAQQLALSGDWRGRVTLLSAAQAAQTDAAPRFSVDLALRAPASILRGTRNGAGAITLQAPTLRVRGDFAAADAAKTWAGNGTLAAREATLRGGALGQVAALPVAATGARAAGLRLDFALQAAPQSASPTNAAARNARALPSLFALPAQTNDGAAMPSFPNALATGGARLTARALSLPLAIAGQTGGGFVTLQNISADLRNGAGGTDLPRFAATFAGGEVRGTARLTPRGTAAQLMARGVDVARLQNLLAPATRRDAQIEGRANALVEVTPGAATRAEVRLVSGALRVGAGAVLASRVPNFPLQNARATLLVAPDGAVQVREARLWSDGARLAGDATMRGSRWDGNLTVSGAPLDKLAALPIAPAALRAADASGVAGGAFTFAFDARRAQLLALTGRAEVQLAEVFGAQISSLGAQVSLRDGSDGGLRLALDGVRGEIEGSPVSGAANADFARNSWAAKLQWSGLQSAKLARLQASYNGAVFGAPRGPIFVAPPASKASAAQNTAFGAPLSSSRAPLFAFADAISPQKARLTAPKANRNAICLDTFASPSSRNALRFNRSAKVFNGDTSPLKQIASPFNSDALRFDTCASPFKQNASPSKQIALVSSANALATSANASAWPFGGLGGLILVQNEGANANRGVDLARIEGLDRVFPISGALGGQIEASGTLFDGRGEFAPRARDGALILDAGDLVWRGRELGALRADLVLENGVLRAQTLRLARAAVGGDVPLIDVTGTVPLAANAPGLDAQIRIASAPLSFFTDALAESREALRSSGIAIPFFERVVSYVDALPTGTTGQLALTAALSGTLAAPRVSVSNLTLRDGRTRLPSGGFSPPATLDAAFVFDKGTVSIEKAEFRIKKMASPVFITTGFSAPTDAADAKGAAQNVVATSGTLAAAPDAAESDDDDTLLRVEPGGYATPDGPIELAADIFNANLSQLAPWVPALRGGDGAPLLRGELSEFSFRVGGTTLDPTIIGSIQGENLQLQNYAIDRLRVSRFEVGNGAIRIAPGNLTVVKGAFQSSAPYGTVPWSWQVPGPVLDGPIDVHFPLQTRDFGALVGAFVPALSVADAGEFNGSVDVGGTLRSPALSGAITIRDGQFRLDQTRGAVAAGLREVSGTVRFVGATQVLIDEADPLRGRLVEASTIVGRASRRADAAQSGANAAARGVVRASGAATAASRKAAATRANQAAALDPALKLAGEFVLRGSVVRPAQIDALQGTPPASSAGRNGNRGGRRGASTRVEAVLDSVAALSRLKYDLSLGFEKGAFASGSFGGVSEVSAGLIWKTGEDNAQNVRWMIAARGQKTRQEKSGGTLTSFGALALQPNFAAGIDALARSGARDFSGEADFAGFDVAKRIDVTRAPDRRAQVTFDRFSGAVTGAGNGVLDGRLVVDNGASQQKAPASAVRLQNAALRVQARRVRGKSDIESDFILSAAASGEALRGTSGGAYDDEIAPEDEIEAAPDGSERESLRLGGVLTLSNAEIYGAPAGGEGGAALLSSLPGAPRFDMRLKMGRDVEVVTAAFRSGLEGELVAKGTPNDPQISGILNTRGGQVRFPNARARVDEGRVTIALGRDPQSDTLRTRLDIDATARGQAGRYAITLRLRGPLDLSGVQNTQTLQIDVTSNPPLSQSEALQQLLGTAPDLDYDAETNSYKTGSVNRAYTNAVLNVLSAPLFSGVEQTLAQTLGLTSVGFQYRFNEPLAVQVTKALGDRVFVSYRRSLGSGPTSSLATSTVSGRTPFELRIEYRIKGDYLLGLQTDERQIPSITLQRTRRF